MTRITNRDIAKLAGVSPTAVSLAVNGKKGVSDETRERVLEIVRQNNYIPNPNSRRLLSKRTGNIVVLFSRGFSKMEEMFYMELNHSILTECDNNSYNMIFTTYGMDGGHVKLPNILLARDVDGVIIYGDADEHVALAIERLELPVVTLDSARPPVGGNLSVRVDYDNLTCIAMRHLIEYGHRDIAYIGNSRSYYFNNMTFNGFKRTAAESGLTIPLDFIQTEAFDRAGIDECVSSLMGGCVKPTAIFCATDFSALTAIRKLFSLGMTVPGDISIVGVDDVLSSQLFVPALTTVRVDRGEMGRVGMKLLLQKIEGSQPESVTISSGDLVIRESTGRLV